MRFKKKQVADINVDFVRTALHYRHPNYSLTVELASRISVHANGVMPERLIAIRRPSEPPDVFEYRKQIYKPKTQETIGKVFSELQKIRRSQDWNIAYDPDNVPAKITQNETMQQYCEVNYPGFGSITNWAFSELLKRYLTDANSIVAMVLDTDTIEANEYQKPRIEVFDSHQVLDYVEDDYVVLKSADKNVFRSGNNKYIQGDIIYIITTTSIFRYKQITGKSDMELDLSYNHNLGYLPAFKAGGEYKERVNNTTIYNSRIHYMIPSLDEAAREYSDLQAEIVQHIFSEKYYYTNTECPDCRGVGKTKEKINCKRCEGVGSLANKSPYGTLLVSMGKAGEQATPTPPMGYIQKDTAIARLQDERVEKHKYEALAAINMEFLSKVGLNQSGVAKEVDRDALNTFVNSIAEDIVRILDKVYTFICDCRYSIIVPNSNDRNKLLPKIQVPEKFDILNASYFMDELVKSDGKVNAIVKKSMELEYIRKRYNTEPNKADELQCVFDLDPFYGNTQDEKMTMLANDGITELDYVISCNVVNFVAQAINEHDGFLRKKYKEKKDIIRKYAETVISENSAAEKIKKELENKEVIL